MNRDGSEDIFDKEDRLKLINKIVTYYKHHEINLSDTVLYHFKTIPLKQLRNIYKELVSLTAVK